MINHSKRAGDVLQSLIRSDGGYHLGGLRGGVCGLPAVHRNGDRHRDRQLAVLHRVGAQVDVLPDLWSRPTSVAASSRGH